MPEQILRSELLIFDLDGTLYHDEHMLRRYLHLLLRSAGISRAEITVWAHIEAVYRGVHGCRMGQFLPVDFQRAVGVREKRSDDYELLAAVHEALDSLNTTPNNGYGKSVFLGDAWSVIFALTHGFGIPWEVFERSFHRVRREVARGTTSFAETDLIATGLNRLRRNYHLVLLTNSAPDTGPEFLRYLELEDVFHEIYFQGGKPDGLSDRLDTLCETHGVDPSRVTSIGDNPRNDLYPVHDVGGATVLVSPFQQLWDGPWTYIAKSVADLGGVVNRIADAERRTVALGGDGLWTPSGRNDADFVGADLRLAR